MLEQLYYKTDGLVGKKILDQIISEALQKQILDEAGGILTRAVGSIYNDAASGKQYELVVAKTLPEKGGSYNTNDELEAELLKVQNQYGIKNIDYQIGDSELSKAAIYVFFKEVNGKNTMGLVKYSRSVQTTTVWSDTDLMNLAGISQARKSGAASASQVNTILVKPDNLVGDNNPRDVSKLYQDVLKKAFALRRKKIPEFPQDTYNHIKLLFEAALSGENVSPELENAASYSQAYNLFLAEVLAPVSVVQNWICAGAREAAREAILGGNRDFSEAKIKFNVGQTQPLFDSTLVHPSGKEIFISSKGGSGAPASVVSLLTNIDDLIKPEKGISTKMRKKNKELYDNFIDNFGKFYNLVKTIGEEGIWTGPIALATQYNILTAEEEKCFREMERYQNLDAAAFKQAVVTTEQELIKNPNKLYIPPSMKKFSDAFTPKDRNMINYKPALHYMSGLATLVVAQLNSDKDLNFDGAAKAALNSCLIQVNSKVKKKGQNCQFDNFVVTYPPKFKGTILADCTKNYSATKLRGKICFKIPV